MPGFTPGRRWQPAYYAFHNDSIPQKALATFERLVKSPLFGCRMCGNCLLQETAFICPMECPKGLRNGPCGGSTPEHCYVDNTRPCIWYKIYERSEKLGQSEKLLEVLPPLDWEKVGTEQWRDLLNYGREGWTESYPKKRSHPKTDGDFDNLWRISPAGLVAGWMISLTGAGNMAGILSGGKARKGQVRSNCRGSAPHLGFSNKIDQESDMLKDFVDAVNFTDNPSPHRACHRGFLCSLSPKWVEPVMQMQPGKPIGRVCSL